MRTVIRSTHMPAPPPAVWEVLADLDAISAWAEFVDHATVLTEQTEGVGAVRRIQAGRNVIRERMTAWEPPSLLAYEFEGLPSIIRAASNTWVIQPVADGSLVSLISRVDAGGGQLGRLVSSAGVRLLGRTSNDLLAGVKERCS